MSKYLIIILKSLFIWFLKLNTRFPNGHFLIPQGLRTQEHRKEQIIVFTLCCYAYKDVREKGNI